MLTDAVTTLPPAGTETTVVPSIVAGVTQLTVTMAPADVTDVQSTSPPVTSSETVVQSMPSTQSANSLTTVTSGESVQMTPSAGAVAGSPNTFMSMADTDTQTIMTTTLAVEGDQRSQISPTVAAGDSGTSVSVSDEGIQVPTSTATAAATDTDTMVLMNQVSSTFATNTEVLNMLSPDSSTTIAADASTDALEAASTTVVNVIPANMSTPNATLSTVTMNSLTTVIPAILNSANATIPSPVTETMMANGLISQSSTETSADTPAGNTPEMTAANDLAMTTNIDGAVDSGTTVVSPVPGTTGDLAEENITITNFTMSSVDNQMAASLVDENTISNRKKKDLTDIINGDTVKDESTDGSPNLRKREARSPRGYFSSYPGQIQLTKISLE